MLSVCTTRREGVHPRRLPLRSRPAVWCSRASRLSVAGVLREVKPQGRLVAERVEGSGGDVAAVEGDHFVVDLDQQGANQADDGLDVGDDVPGTEFCAAKDALFDGFAEVAKPLASGRRAEIVDLLAQGERSVDEIATEIDQSVANTSHHLRSLARGGLLDSRRDGTRIFCSLANDRVAELWAAMRAIAAERVADLDKLAAAYLGERNGFDVVNRAELATRINRGGVVVLDVRPSAEYAAGHISGA